MGERAGVQISKRKLHTHIHLDLVKVEFLSCIKNKVKYTFKLIKLKSDIH